MSITTVLNECKCSDCGTPLQGRARYCMLCFGKHYKPCPGCMDLREKGKFRVRKEGKGRKKTAVNCKLCGNRRWLLS
jgi:hypothetical protein